MCWDCMKLERPRMRMPSRTSSGLCNKFKGKFYVKEALQRLSWAYLFERGYGCRQSIPQPDSPARQYRKPMRIKQAQKEAKAENGRTPCLLKGAAAERRRILSTGASACCTKTGERLQPTWKLKLEYALPPRAAFTMKWGTTPAPSRLYEATIKLGSNRPEYFAARAALQLGYIYEKRGDKAKATRVFPDLPETWKGTIKKIP